MKPPSGTRGDSDCVVEVACGFAVDGNDSAVAEVAAIGNAASDFIWIEMRDGAGFSENILGEDARELMLANHHLDVDAELVCVAENFNNATDGGLGGSGPAGDFDVDDHAFECEFLIACVEVLAEDAMG